MTAGDVYNPHVTACGLYSRPVLPAPLRLLQLHARRRARRSDRGVSRCAGARAELARAAARGRYAVLRRRHADASAAGAACSGCWRSCDSGSRWRPAASSASRPIRSIWTGPKSRVLAAAGVTRVSLGAQSFHAAEAEAAGARSWCRTISQRRCDLRSRRSLIRFRST